MKQKYFIPALAKMPNSKTRFGFACYKSDAPEDEDLKNMLKPTEDGIKKIQKSADEIKAEQDKMKTDFEASQKAFADWQATKDDRDEKNQKALDDLIKKANTIYLPEEYGGGFAGQLKNVLQENHSAIKQVRTGYSQAFNIKGDMTTTGSITGAMARQQLQPAILPNQIFNFRDLVEIVQTSTGLIVLPRETAPTGSASRVPTENTAKPQIEAKFTMVNYTADYIAGYARVSKQMLQDLQFLQTWLPRILLREFYKAENLQFYTDLTAVATGSTTAPGATYAEKLIDYIANLGAANFAANAIITTFAQWATLLKSTSAAGYTLPGGVVAAPDGTIRIAGIPVRPANWVATGKAIVGDFTQAAIAVADTLKVEFFEQDQDNVIKNMITVRVEAREVLVVEQPGAFIFA